MSLNFAYCQLPASKIDSLTSRLNQSLHDTDRVNTLLSLADQYSYLNPDSAIAFASQAKTIARKIIDAKRYFNALKELGWNYYVTGNYPRALLFYNASLAIAEKIKYKKGTSAILGNIGLVYSDQADYPKALDYYFRALKMAEELGDKQGITTDLGNIGGVYHNQGDYPKALDYYFRALKIDEELGNKNGIARHLGNIGSVYRNQGDYPKALDYYFKVLKIDEELGNKDGIATHLGNIGIFYGDQADLSRERGDIAQANRDYPKALDYYFRALKMAEELGNKNGIAIWLGNIGSLYTRTGKFKEAEGYLKQAHGIFDSIGAQNNLMVAEEVLSHLYDTMATAAMTTGKFFQSSELWKSSLLHYKKAIVLKDTIFSQDRQKQIMNFEFEKKEALAQAEHDKQIALSAAETKKQQIISWAIAGGLLLVALIAFLIYRSLRISRKQKRTIEQQKDEVTKQKEIVEQQRDQIDESKKIIEEKHQNITDSMEYASIIQSSVLPTMQDIKELFSESFVFHRPKDIVSGDFYWIYRLNGYKYLLTGDCTGHGVPGAIMSMLCTSLLNEVVNNKGMLGTDVILNEVRKGIITALKQHGKSGEAKDGMDCSLIKLNAANILECSCANNPVWIVSPNIQKNGTLNEISPDKQAVAISDKIKPFTKHSVQLQQGDMIYAITDGYEDQFGGNSSDDLKSSHGGLGKKFKAKKLKELLISIAYKPVEVQKEIIEKTFLEWKGNLEQTDDVTVIGIRI